MPVYFTLQEALSASQTASKDYNPRMTGGREGKAIMVQKPEIKPAIVPEVIESVEPAPIPTEGPTAELQQKVLAAQHRLDSIDINSQAPAKEVYKEPPSKILSASIVFIDPIRADAQDVHGAQTVQARYAQQNDEAWIVKPFAKGSRNAKKAGSKVAWTTGKIIASSVRHPIATAQNMVRDPLENRDIHFAYTVNEIIKKKLFPNNPELALLVPDSFIDNLLVNGRVKRNEKLAKKTWNAIKDFMPVVTTGFIYDTQQKRALEYLSEIIDTDPDGLLKKIEESTLDSGTRLAKRFSQTLVRGNDLLPGQEIIGNNRILLPEEKRELIHVEDEVTHQDKIETQLKEKIKPFVDSNVDMTIEQKKQLVEEVTQIYLENVPEDKLDKNGQPKGEAVVDVLALIDEIKRDPDNLKFYREKWPELKIISYVGESKGDTLGGQERFLTWNQKLAIKSAKNGGGVTNGSAFPALKAVIRIGAYTSGFALSYGLGVSKAVPRSVFGGGVKIVAPFLGPAVAGSVAGLTETQSVHLGKFYQRRSRIDNDLARTSRGKGLGEKTGDYDAVRGNLEDATVETVPAETLTTEINKLILTDPNNFGSETRTPANKEEVLQLLTHMAHTRARIDLTQMSGTKDLDYKTSNWVSYDVGREQEELTNLKASDLQAFARLINLQAEKPNLFGALPFLPTPDGDLNEALKSMTTVIKAGLIEGLPSELINGSPLSNFKGQKFYKQIFNASGIPETETDQVFNFINSLKTTSKVGLKTVGEWMDEAESFRSRMKALKKIRDSRFRFAAATGAITSEVMGEVTHLAQEHIVQPIMEHISPDNPQPVAPAGPDQLPNQSPDTNNQTLTIDLPNIFKEPSDGAVHILNIYDHNTNKISAINIPLADGFKFDVDGAKNVDIQDASGNVVYENVFVYDPDHQAIIPNPHFIPDSAHPGVEVDLSKHIDFKTEQNVGIDGGGEPVELTGGAAIVDYLKTHYREAMTTIVHRDVMKEQHALTTFIDLEGKVHITQGGYTAPNAFTGQPDDLTAGLESGNGALWFTFGKNADGSATPGVPLSFEGIKVPLTWNGHHGEFIFDPHHPTTPQEVLLSKLIDQSALNDFKANEPNQWLNESDLGKLWMGIRGYEGGFMSETPDGPKMHDFEMEFTGENNSLKITPPETTTFTETTSLIPPTPVEVTIKGEPIPPEPIQPVQPTPTDSTVSSAFPGPYVSPQLHPAIAETPIPASFIPLPQSIINASEFKKEKQPNGYTNTQAFNFLSGLPDDQTTGRRVDEFIYDHVFNQTQNNFIQLPATADFINHDVSLKTRSLLPTIYEKMRNGKQLSPIERDELKTVILAEGKDRGLTDQEALTINTLIVHRTYLRSLYSAVQEKKQLDEQLSALENALANSTRIPPHINPPPGNPPPGPRLPKPKRQSENLSQENGIVSGNQLFEMYASVGSIPEERSEMEEIVDDYLSALLNVSIDKINRVPMAIHFYREKDGLIDNLVTHQHRQSGPDSQELKENLDNFNRLMKAFYPDDFTPRITELHDLYIQLDNVKINLKTGKVIFPEDEMSDEERAQELIETMQNKTTKKHGDDFANWFNNPDHVPGKDPDHAVATDIVIDDSDVINSEKAGRGELRKSFEDYDRFSKQVANLKQKAERRKTQIGQQDGDEFAFFSDPEWKNINDEMEAATKQLEDCGWSISSFEQSKLPVILGGTFDSIVANSNDNSQDVHSFYYHGFRDAFRNYMVDYASRGRDADNEEIRMAFNKLKSGLQEIDPSVNLVRFEDFMNGIRAVF